MGYIYVLMGKSATGKDSIYKKILSCGTLDVTPIVLYTTRPQRAGEIEGNEYHFVTFDYLKNKRKEKRVVEERCFNTVLGPWYYFTLDYNINLSEKSYLTINTLDGFNGIKHYFGEKNVIPIYIEISEIERLSRAVKRELKQDYPNPEELCRRFLADNKDFSEDKLQKSGIIKENRFVNEDLEKCIKDIIYFIKKEGNSGYKNQSVSC